MRWERIDYGFGASARGEGCRPLRSSKVFLSSVFPIFCNKMPGSYQITIYFIALNLEFFYMKTGNCVNYSIPLTSKCE